MPLQIMCEVIGLRQTADELGQNLCDENGQKLVILEA
jgi:hypothetical protein